jgi:hypothetical protein
MRQFGYPALHEQPQSARDTPAPGELLKCLRTFLSRFRATRQKLSHNVDTILGFLTEIQQIPFGRQAVAFRMSGVTKVGMTSKKMRAWNHYAGVG